MATKDKDFLERVIFAVLFSAIGVAIPFFTDADYVWAPIIVAALQVGKNMVAQHVGDPNTSGFTDTGVDAELDAGDVEYAGEMDDGEDVADDVADEDLDDDPDEDVAEPVAGESDEFVGGH